VAAITLTGASRDRNNYVYPLIWLKRVRTLSGDWALF